MGQGPHGNLNCRNHSRLQEMQYSGAVKAARRLNPQNPFETNYLLQGQLTALVHTKRGGIVVILWETF